MANRKIPREKLLEVWNTSESPEQAAKRLKMNPNTLRAEVVGGRKFGYPFKKFPSGRAAKKAKTK